MDSSSQSINKDLAVILDELQDIANRLRYRASMNPLDDIIEQCAEELEECIGKLALMEE